MFDLSTLRLGRLVGMRVRELRDAKGWNQRDFADALNGVSTGWTRAKVGQLEAAGVRGEKLTDLAMICLALEVSLEELLSGDQPGTEQLREALAGPKEGTSTDSPVAIDPSRIGAEDVAAEMRLAERLGTSLASTRELSRQVFAGGTPSQVRDVLAGIDESTQRHEARAKRGRAMRRVYTALEAGEADEELLARLSAWIDSAWTNGQTRTANNDDG